MITPVLYELNRLAACSLLLITLAACGGGGGGGGGGGSPTGSTEIPVTLGAPGPGDTVNYFPIETGNFWHYKGTSTDPLSTPPFENTLTVLGSRTVEGSQRLDLLESNPAGEGQSFAYSMVKDLNGLAMVEVAPTSDPLETNLVPYWELRFGLAVGESFVQLNRNGVDSGMDLDGDGRNETVDVRSVVTNLGREAVAVPGVGVQDAAIYGREMTLNIRASSNGQSVSATSSDKAWFVANIGKVKSVSTFTADGASETITEVLDAYRIGHASFAVETAGAVMTGSVSPGQTRLYALPAVTGQTALVSLSSLTGDADLTVYSGAYVALSEVSIPGTQSEIWIFSNPGGIIYAGVTGKENANFLLGAATKQDTGTPVVESAMIQPDVPTSGQVGTRGTSLYQTTDLPLGSHTVSIVGLSAAADLHVYAGDTYSTELDCTLRSISPVSCTVPQTTALYFAVSSGAVNREGSFYTIIVH